LFTALPLATAPLREAHAQQPLRAAILCGAYSAKAGED